MAKRKSLASALKHHQAYESKRSRLDHVHAQKQSKKPLSASSTSAAAAPPPPRRRPLVPFTKDDALLFVGEGNFSFSASCIEHHLEHGESVTATSFDSESLVLSKYPDAATHIATLKDLCASVAHDIDATRLHAYYAPDSFDVVIFMFPHAGAGIADQDRNVLTNQKLLQAFFKSVHSVLRDRGTVAMTLATNAAYESWDAKGLAKKEGLIVKTSGVFDGRAFPGYSHRRTQGHHERDAGFSGGKGEERAARWTIFMKKGDAAGEREQKHTKARAQSDDDDDD